MTTSTAIVTGASAGIGAATVRALAATGWTVHAVARRADRLTDLATETGCTPHAIDVTDTEGLAALAGIPADGLVNAAGLGRGITGLANATPEDVERTVATNVTAVLHLTRILLPGMVTRGRGHIVNIGSVAGLYPVPWAIYGATKGAIRQMSRNLRLELAGTPLRVTDIQPGRVATEFYEVTFDDPDDIATAKNTGIEELTPDDVAGAVAYAMNAPGRVNISALEMQPTAQVFGGTRFGG